VSHASDVFFFFFFFGPTGTESAVAWENGAGMLQATTDLYHFWLGLHIAEHRTQGHTQAQQWRLPELLMSASASNSSRKKETKEEKNEAHFLAANHRALHSQYPLTALLEQGEPMILVAATYRVVGDR